MTSSSSKGGRTSSVRRESPKFNIKTSHREQSVGYSRDHCSPNLIQEGVGCSPGPCSPWDWSPCCFSKSKVSTREGQPSSHLPSAPHRGTGGSGKGTHKCTHAHTYTRASVTRAHTHTMCRELYSAPLGTRSQTPRGVTSCVSDKEAKADPGSHCHIQGQCGGGCEHRNSGAVVSLLYPALALTLETLSHLAELPTAGEVQTRQDTARAQGP